MRKVERRGCMKPMLVKTSENSYMIWWGRGGVVVRAGRGVVRGFTPGGWWGALIQGVPFLYEVYSCI